jgi:uncharacterized protein (TIGR02118 family)
MIKMVCLLKRKDTISHDAFIEHWQSVHAPLAHAVGSIRRYVQSDIRETQSRADIPDIAADIDGIAELWFDNHETMTASQHDPAMQRLLADGATFIGEIKTFIVDEREIVRRSAK